MSDMVILYLKSGQHVEGCLDRPFRPQDSEIEIQQATNGQRHVFALEELCAIAFAASPPWFRPTRSEGIEIVEIVTGETFRVESFPPEKCRLGFLGLRIDADAACRTIFFTFSGVRSRNQERKLGQILLAEKLISEEQISETLASQSKLRERRIGEVISAEAAVPHDRIEKTLRDAGNQRVRVGDILVEAGLVTREQVEEAFASQQEGKRMRVGELLLSRGLITEEQLLKALAAKFRLEFVDLDSVTPSPEALGALSEGLVDRLQVFPIALEGRTLTVATSAPTDAELKDAIRFSTGLNVEMVVANSEQIGEAITAHYRQGRGEVDELLTDLEDDALAVPIEEEEEEIDEVALSAETDSTIIALVNRLLIDAYQKGASDLHLEPAAGKSPARVRYRIDGECRTAHNISGTYKAAIVARLKILAGLDITERRRPQSGKILLRYRQRKLEYRVEVTPTVGGLEDVVLRLLSASKPLPLEAMDFSPPHFDRFCELLEKPHGIILCVGPTGSGKTTTLHSALKSINTPQRKIWTVEDPVEITQPGLRQVQVNHKIGFGFAEALRSFLRADPDVIMVGEMRDQETARIALEASLTGHLVFSTLHTNSAAETVVRLIEMGMDPLNFSDALLGIVAQRLVRRLCPECAGTGRPERETYEELVEMFAAEGGDRTLLPTYDEATVGTRTGCQKCDGSGYRGRLALHELLVGSPAIKEGVRKGQNADQLRTVAIGDGMLTLRMDGILKIFTGQTDIEQVNRVCL